jgi:magnesium chelatase subunit D
MQAQSSPALPLALQARWAAALLAVDPTGLGGLLLRAQAGPVRDAWLTLLRSLMPAGTSLQRLPLQASDDRLLGGLDLAATLAVGRPVAQQGLLAAAHGGLLLVHMAERLPARTAAHLCAALDTGTVQLEREGLSSLSAARFAVLACDEALPDDAPFSAALADRLGLQLDINGLSLRDVQSWSGLQATPETEIETETETEAAAVKAARSQLSRVVVPDDITQALCAAGLALGVHSPRAAWLAQRATRAAAALQGRLVATVDDASVAACLVLAPRATQQPVVADETEEQADTQDGDTPESDTTPAADQPPPPPQKAQTEDAAPPDTTEQPPSDPAALQDRLVAAAMAALPPGVLAQLMGLDKPRSAGNAGRAGAAAASKNRGRPLAAKPGVPQAGSRLHLVATLRAAAPWQRLRRAQQIASQATQASQAVQVRAADFHVQRFQQRRTTTTIFAIDASGSSALHRLAEAKGAVELLLAECYVRRDEVAVVSFRGSGAELLLPPTRSLVRAKRCLAGLPGGGGTPLAAGLDATALLAGQVKRQGATPLVVVLTDGRANVARSGQGGRAQAQADALAASRRLRLLGVQVLLVDTSVRAEPAALALAVAMGARYLPLPLADAQSMARAVVSYQKRD